MTTVSVLRITARDDSAAEKACDIRSALITYFDNNQFMQSICA